MSLPLSVVPDADHPLSRHRHRGTRSAGATTPTALTRPVIAATPPAPVPTVAGYAQIDLRHTFGQVAASTWVVTASGTTGPVGFTAVSVASVSLDPPLLSFNVDKASVSLVTIAQSSAAALHLLAEDQADVARRFAGPRDSRFADDGTWHHDDHGLPLVHGASARLVTRVHDLVDAGDSFVVIARVVHTTSTGRAPLVHHGRDYRTLGARA